MKSSLLVLVLVVVLSECALQKYSAHYDKSSKTWRMEEGGGGVAWATLDSSVNTTGWYTMNIESNAAHDDYLQAFATGFIEGALAHEIIWLSWMNGCNGTTCPPLSKGVQKFMFEQDVFVRGNADHPTENIDYWNQVRLVIAQFDGIIQGYTQYAPAERQLSYVEWLLYQLSFEIGDIQAAVAARGKELHTYTYPHRRSFHSHLNRDLPTDVLGSHCSVLVKVNDDHSKLFASHVTWSTFTTMLRVFKHVKNPFSLKSTIAPVVSYSSFPGLIPSGDDYYLTSANLVVMETTIGVMNSSLFANYVVPQTVPYWIRITVANRMAVGGADWVRYFSLYNSGTYNNEWIVVDNKLFNPSKPLVANTLWIADQIPGYVISADETRTLQSNGYWPSYNIPYFPFVYNISEYPQYFAKYGNSYSYTHCARANIFRRDQSKVQTLKDMKDIMRYNKYQIDPLALQDACRGISARCDLNTPWATNTLNGYAAFGGIDAKITDNDLSSQMTTEAVSGPSWESQPIFAWTSEWNGVPHWGQPTVFNFPFVAMKPQHNLEAA